jgi:hypothetical protein
MKKLIILLSCLWITIVSMANNVNISNISLVGSAGNYRVQFDLSWEHGWRVSTGQNNYDGVWVFFKFSTGGAWQHLVMTGAGNSVPVNYTAYQNTGATKTGAIIHRSNNFAGTTTLTNIELGITDIPFGIDIRGYAVEMVYIPQCSNCIIGDGSGTGESASALHVADNTSGALGNTFSVDVNALDDAVLETGIAINAAGIAGNAAFATGQAAWTMKYELSQGGYRDFLNSLTLAQQTTRTFSAPTSSMGTYALAPSFANRNAVRIATPSNGVTPAVYGLDVDGDNLFNEGTDGEWVACNFLSWGDIAAYLDWAGLSPLTEILYERICRGASSFGPNSSIAGEYAWGTTGIFASMYNFDISFIYRSFEGVINASSTLGNAYYSSTLDASVNGPVRNGIFATSSSNRISSGASFYGVMEMSGNLLEPTVTLGNAAGRAFTSVNGDGALSVNGNANAANWPCGAVSTALPVCAEVTGAAGTKNKGGAFNFLDSGLPVSVRNVNTVQMIRDNNQGCRGVLYVN